MLTYPNLHHVGIVQPQEADALALMALLGLEEDYRGYVAQWQALCIFTKKGNGTPIEFVIPNGGPLEKFNKGAGGLHHIALEISNFETLENKLHAEGMRLLEDKPVKGAGNFLCNFLSPIYTRGITVEFIQLLD
jgi:methylmalonyl-CoA/ethylmalonyl-CoA epimerase